MVEARLPMSPPESSSLLAMLNTFLRSRKLKGRSSRTTEAYSLAANQLRRYMLETIGSDSILLATRDVIEDFLIDHMEHARSSTTANKTYRQLRAWFNWLWNEELIETNPFQGRRKVGAPTVIHHSKTGFSVDEAKKILRGIESHLDSGGREGWLALRDRALVLVLYDTGLRVTEITNMSFEGLDLPSGLFEVPGKGGHFYQRHLGAASMLAISRYTHTLTLAGITSGKLWRNHAGYHFTRSGMYRMCIDRAAAVGIKNGNPHRWRYTHGEVLEDLGWSESIIMAEMGHKTLAVSRQYREGAIRRKALKQHAEQSPADILVAHIAK